MAGASGPVLLLSATVVKYRDAYALLAFGLQFLLFASPIAYPPEFVPEPWRTLLYVNPVAGAVALLRSALVDGTLPPALPRLSGGAAAAVFPARTAPLPAQRARVRGHHLMATASIELDGVAKRYRLGEHHGTGTDLRETLTRAMRRVRGGSHRNPSQELWSLRDVTFAVEEGTALGIIGANGAGKSTLLKVINNITTPTLGRCRTRGRVGSLLEVGTGFHGELTGRENTYLNGAILGMRRQEVTRPARRHRRVRRPRAVHGHAGQAVLVGDVLAPRALPSPRTWKPTSSWWTRCSPSATRSSSANVWAR